MANKKSLLRIFASVFVLVTVVAGCEINGPEYEESKEGSTKSPVELTVGKWEKGEIVKLKGDKLDEQWFKIVATATTQRIYVKLGTLTDLCVYLYDSSSDRIGNEFRAEGKTGTVKYAEWSLTKGLTYSVKVVGRNADRIGAYWIGFTNMPAQPETIITDLSAKTWANGTIVSSESGGTGEQWFKFVATASTQYIYLKRSTVYRATLYLYDKNFNRIGNELDNYNAGVKNTSYLLSTGDTYYVQVSGRGYAGTYWIGFTDFPAEPETDITDLTKNVWTNGTIVSSSSGGSGEQWFKFIASDSTQYIYLKRSTIYRATAYLYDKDFNRIGNEIDNYNDGVQNSSYSLNKDKTYYIQVSGRGYAGTYWIGFTDFPAQPETVITDLSFNTWSNGEIVLPNSGGTGEQWFKFVATSFTQYIFLKRSTIYRATAYLYDSSYNRIGNDLDNYNDGNKKASYSVNRGATYYIQVSGRGNAGTYWLAFNSTGNEPQ